MEIDMQKLDTAILYLQRIADGKNPVNNMPADEESVLNNPNVIRCMFFTKEVLEEVKRNGGNIGKKLSKKDLPPFPVEVLKEYVYRADKPITKFVEQMNELVDSYVYQKINYKVISDYLKENGYLMVVDMPDGKTSNRATEKGNSIGIISEERTSTSGKPYIATLYTEKAQVYVIEHIKEILG